MFHVKRKLPILLLVSLLTAVLASGCIQAASSRGWAQPVQFGDLLLVTASRGKLDAIDPQTGDRKWRFPDDWSIWNREAEKLRGIYAQPQVSGDTVYVGDYNGFVYAFKPSEASVDKASRRPVGLFKLQGSIVGGISLDTANDTLYVTTDEGWLYALNATDIKQRTSSDKNVRLRPPFDAGDRIWTPPVASGGRVYFGTTAGVLFAIDTSSWSSAWQPFKAGAALVSAPVVAGDKVLIGGFDGRLYAVDVGTGKEIWRFEAEDWIWTKPLVDGDRVFFADFKGNVFAVSLSDGTALWEQPFPAGTSVRSSPVLSGGNLIIANDDGDLFGIDPGSGRQAWGPLEVGTSIHADLLATDSTLYVAPTRCTSEETAGEVYYYKVNTTTRERQSTGSVC